MSNPAVIMLTDVSTKSGGRFKIEDNIGEAIHIHYDNFRIDLTIKEFFEFAELIEGCLISLIDNPDFNINNYDPSFLLDIYYMIPDLEGISFEKVFTIKSFQAISIEIFSLTLLMSTLFCNK